MSGFVITIGSIIIMGKYETLYNILSLLSVGFFILYGLKITWRR